MGPTRGGRLLGGLLGAGRSQDADHLVQRQRPGTRLGADEAGDARGVAHRSPRAVGQVHPDQDVAGVDLPLHLLRLAVLDLGDFFFRDLDLEDEVLHVERLDPVLEVRLDLVLVPGVRVHDVPAARRVLQRGAHLSGRILVQFLGGLLDRDLGGRLLRHRLGSGLLGGRVVERVDDGVAVAVRGRGGCGHGSTRRLVVRVDVVADGERIVAGHGVLTLCRTAEHLLGCAHPVVIRRPCRRPGGTGRPGRTPTPP